MSEKISVPLSPADKPNGGDGKQRPIHHPRGKMRPLDRLIGRLTTSGRSELRQERKEKSAVQREAERTAHLSEPETLLTRLKEFDKALGTLKFHDPAVGKAVAMLHKAARTLHLPKSVEEKQQVEKRLAEEARIYIHAGLIPRDAAQPINSQTVARHIRTYLIWRWTEETWKKEWTAWNEKQAVKKNMPGEVTSKTVHEWHDGLNRWVRVRDQHHAQKVTNEPRRPPGPYQQNLMLMIARRVGQDHISWEVDPIKPEIAK